MLRITKLSFKRIRAFTLIELMVATSLFVLVLTIAADSLFSAQLVNTQLERTQIILDGVNLAAEVMVRDIRFGSEFNCGTLAPAPTLLRKSCPYSTGAPVGTVLVFKPTIPLEGTLNPRYDRVAYYLRDNAIYKNEYPYGGSARTYQITSSDVTITTMGFYSLGVNSMDGSSDVGGATDVDQPMMIVMIAGITKPTRGRSGPVTFKMHTAATSRTTDR